MMEMVLALAMIASAFRFDLAPRARVEPRAMFTLRPRDGVPVIPRPATERIERTGSGVEGGKWTEWRGAASLLRGSVGRSDRSRIWQQGKGHAGFKSSRLIVGIPVWQQDGHL
jgi:hypothetical protein